MGMATIQVKIMVAKVTAAVRARRSQISSATGRCHCSETPKSPCSMRHTHLT